MLILAIWYAQRASNKMEYNGIIEDMLTQQGYKQGVNYESIFDWGTAITHIKKLTDIKPIHRATA